MSVAVIAAIEARGNHWSRIRALGDHQFIAAGRKVVKHTDSGKAACDQAMCGLANVRLGMRGYFIPRQASR